VVIEFYGESCDGGAVPGSLAPVCGGSTAGSAGGRRVLGRGQGRPAGCAGRGGTALG
jgi:hypothetical protein